MNASSDAAVPCGATPLRVIAIRAAILVGLSFLLFRDSLIAKSGEVVNGSEWSHAIAWPVLAAVYLWCRGDELRSQATRGSNFGMILFVLGAAIYFAVLSFGLFSQLFVVAMLICLAGAIWFAAGWKVLRVCVPLLFMLSLTVPLSERSMDRFTLSLQLQSRRAAALASVLLPSIDLQAQGKELIYTYEGQSKRLVIAEQRLGARWPAAYATICLFVVFCRRRTMARIVACLVLCIPVAAVCKVFHLLVWTAVAAYGGFAPVSAIPRNIALALALVGMCIGTAVACWLVDKLAAIPEMFVVGSPDEEDAETQA